jgi:hypothetical protein
MPGGSTSGKIPERAGRVRRRRARTCRSLAQGAEAVLLDAGLDWEAIAKLRERGGLG